VIGDTVWLSSTEGYKILSQCSAVLNRNMLAQCSATVKPGVAHSRAIDERPLALQYLSFPVSHIRALVPKSVHDRRPSASNEALPTPHPPQALPLTTKKTAGAADCTPTLQQGCALPPIQPESAEAESTLHWCCSFPSIPHPV